MFDELQQNQALLEITIIFIVLVGIAIWQQLKLASVIMSGIYFSYLFFYIFNPIDQNIEKTEIPIPIKGVIFAFTLLSIIKIFALE